MRIILNVPIWVWLTLVAASAAAIEPSLTDDDNRGAIWSTHGWNILTENWPPPDDANGAGQTPFYLQENYDDVRFPMVRLQFNRTFLATMDEKIPSGAICTIRFHLWFFEHENWPPEPTTTKRSAQFMGVNLHLPYQNGSLSLSKLYPATQWNPLSFQIDYDRLDEFSLEFHSGTHFVAFRDFRVEFLRKNPLPPVAGQTILWWQLYETPVDQNCLSFTFEVLTIPATNPVVSYLIGPQFIRQKLANADDRVPFVSLPVFSSTSRGPYRQVICLGEYLNFKTERYALILEHTPEITNIQVNPEPVKSNQTEDLYFLNGFYDAKNSTWHQEWFDLVEPFSFEPDAISVHFECPRDRKETATAPANANIALRTSSKWIRFSNDWIGNANTIPFQFETDNLWLRPRICDQLGMCHEVNITWQQLSADGHNFRTEFAITKSVPVTGRFRLELTFDVPYAMICRKQRKFSGRFRLRWFGDPCRSPDFRCQNGGTCVSSVTSYHGPQCNCPAGFRGQWCQWPDYCQRDGGNQLCHQLDLPQCINQDTNGYKCLCNKPDVPIWNGKSCTKVKSLKDSYPRTLKLRGDGKRHRQADLFRLELDTKDLDAKHDLCITVRWNMTGGETCTIGTMFRFGPDNNVSIRHHSWLNSTGQQRQTFCLVNDFINYWSVWKFFLKRRQHFVLGFDLEWQCNWQIECPSIRLEQVSVQLGRPDVRAVGSESKSRSEMADWRVLTNESGRLVMETEWHNFRPKIDMIQFEPITDEMATIDNISARIYWFDGNFTRLQELPLAVTNGSAEQPIVISGLTALNGTVGLFKIQIQLLLPLDKFGPKLQYRDWICQYWDCFGAPCIGDYRLGRPRCLCAQLKRFGDRCEHPDPCVKNKNKCRTIIDDDLYPDRCQPINGTDFRCTCSWPGLLNYIHQRNGGNCRMAAKYRQHELRFDVDGDNAFLTNVFSVNRADFRYDDTVHRYQFHPITASVYRTLNRTRLPYYFTQMPGNSSLLLTYPAASELLPNRDFCLLIRYELPTGSLGIKLDSNGEFLWTSGDTGAQRQRVCLRQWSSPEFRDGFRANITASLPENTSVIGFQVIHTETVEYSASNLEYIPERMSAAKLWTLTYPDSVWSTGPNDSLQYKINDQNDRATALSVWIRNSTIKRHRFRYRLVNWFQLSPVIVDPIIFDDSMKDITQLCRPKNGMENATGAYIMEFELPATTVWYRVGFRVNLNPQGLQTIGSPIIIDRIDVDDYCMGNLCQNGAQCQVELRNDKPGYRCVCRNGYLGPYCEQIDHCKMNETRHHRNGNEICAENGAQCVNMNKTFWCRCPVAAEQYWDPVREKCLPVPAPLVKDYCPDNEVWLGDKCNCAAGYHRDPNRGSCDMDDPCSSTGLPTANATCFSSFSAAFKTNAIILCNEGFANDDGHRVCRSIRCRSPIWNVCSQECQLDGDQNYDVRCTCRTGYRLQNGTLCLPEKDPQDRCRGADCERHSHAYCDPTTGNCRCNDLLFRWTNNSCRTTDPEKTERPECPGRNPAIFQPNTQLYHCDCSQIGGQLNWKLEPETGMCRLEPICRRGGPGFQECVLNMGAMCLVEPAADNGPNYRCQCPPGQHPVNLTADGRVGPVCQPHCADPAVVQRCQKFNAVCDPLALLEPECRCDNGTIKVHKSQTEFECHHTVNRFGLSLLADADRTYRLSADYAEKFFNLQWWWKAVSRSEDPLQEFYRRYHQTLSDANLQELFWEYKLSHQDNQDRVRQSLQALQPLMAERLLERYIRIFLDPLNVTAVSVNGCSRDGHAGRARQRCQVVIAFNADITTSAVATSIDQTLEDQCLPYGSDGNCFIDLNQNRTFLVLGLAREINIQRQTPCTIETVCQAFPGTECQDEHRCVCIPFDGPLWRHDGTARPAFGLMVDQCVVNKTYVCQNETFCPKRFGYDDDHCRAKTFGRQINVHCDCLKWPLISDTGNIHIIEREPLNIARINDCTVNATMACQQCPQNSTYRPGHCQVWPNNTRLMIRCQCASSETIDDRPVHRPVAGMAEIVNECYDRCDLLDCGQNGHCSVDPDHRTAVRCICDEGWTGDRCQNRNDNRQYALYAIAAAGVLVVISMIVSLYLWCRNTVGRSRSFVGRKYSFEMQSRGTYQTRRTAGCDVVISPPRTETAVVSQHHKLVERDQAAYRMQQAISEAATQTDRKDNEYDDDDDRPPSRQPPAPPSAEEPPSIIEPTSNHTIQQRNRKRLGNSTPTPFTQALERNNGRLPKGSPIMMTKSILKK